MNVLSRARRQESLDTDGIRMLSVAEEPMAASREQWDDADNLLAMRPGVVPDTARSRVSATSSLEGK
ncbi:arginine deiminase [Microbacterium foliorum]|uniref:Arginine deiminase n=1 Tax=Microbacterium foliorum TaxID=104336 RepID=A0ABU1HW74_9MICO|nr:arginine deiminase [Microbacterium foliorum]